MTEMPYEMEARRVFEELAAARARQMSAHERRCRGAECPMFARCAVRRSAAAGRLDEGYPQGQA
jgi:hypothetical protein